MLLYLPAAHVISVYFFTFLFILSLLARSEGIAFGGFLVILSTLLLCLVILFQRNMVFIHRLIIVVFLLLALSVLQYWIPIRSSLIFLPVLLVFLILTFRRVRTQTPVLLLLTALLFIFMSSVLLNPRRFHNLYRYVPYESYLRQRYSLWNSPLADLSVEKYKMTDTLRARQCLEKALAAEAREDFDEALHQLDLSIDADPDNANTYHKRGALKLLRLDIDADVAYSAIKDFSKAISLDPDLTLAYFHRAYAYGYLDEKAMSLVDSRVVWYRDSSLTEEQFRSRYGVSKETFSVPFHP